MTWASFLSAFLGVIEVYCFVTAFLVAALALFAPALDDEIFNVRNYIKWWLIGLAFIFVAMFIPTCVSIVFPS